MPRIDPQQLLGCLTPLLAQNGGIKSSSEVERLGSLMEKYSKKLVSKCIYIQILKSTKTELLCQFMAFNGWSLVNNWLNDGSRTENWPFVQELLEMLLLCPVDSNRLKSNDTPKVVKNLSLTCQDSSVRCLSKKLVEQWLKIAHQEKKQLAASQNVGINGTSIEESQVLAENKVNEISQVDSVNGTVLSDTKSEDESSRKQSKENIKYKVSNKEGSGKLLLSLKRSTSPSSQDKDAKTVKTSVDSKSKSSSDKSKKSSSSSSKSSSSSSKSSSQKDKDRSSSSNSSSSHHKSSSSSRKHSSSKSSSSRTSSSTSSSRDKHKDGEKPKKESEKSQAEKDKETLNLLTPLSSTKLQRIPKRQHSDNSENKSAESNKDEGSPSKVPKTGEAVEKKKPSMSIEVRKGDKPKTVKTLNSQFRNHGLAEEPPKPPSRKDLKKPGTTSSVIPTALPSSPIVKTSLSPPPSKKPHIEKSFEPDVPERAGGVKLIKPKPILVESIGFMDALSASAVPSKKDPKKRKRLLSGKKDEPESPKIETKPLKFYKDTLEEADDDQTSGEKSPSKELEASNAKKAGSKSPDSSTVHDSTDVKTDNSPEVEEPEEKRGPGIGCGPDGPHGVLVSPNMPRRKKRPIRWRPDDELTEIRYFELDETERTNVTKTSFTEQKQMEHTNEKNAFQIGRKMQSDDTMAEQTIWRSLIIVDNVPTNVIFGCKSREAKIQAEREKTVLQEIFFRHSINDSPHEPDVEVYEHEEPQIIPLEDITGNTDSITNFTDIQWPQPKGELPAAFSSNAFMNVFSGINIPPVMGLAPVGIANPLANFPLGGIPNHITREPQAPMWMVPPAVSFMQQPPPMIPQQVPNLHNRAQINNNYRSNNSNRNNNNNGGNWVRGNSRRGTCNQFKRSGFCRNKNCPYIHER